MVGSQLETTFMLVLKNKHLFNMSKLQRFEGILTSHVCFNQSQIKQEGKYHHLSIYMSNDLHMIFTTNTMVTILGWMHLLYEF